MTDREVAKREDQAVQAERSQTEPVYMPEVDIWENDDHVRLDANMPGVDQQSVEVTVENDVLTIEGRARVDAPEGYELVGQEYGAGRYRRDFTLSGEVNADAIKARVKHGVLHLSIPKREEVKTKKIEIES